MQTIMSIILPGLLFWLTHVTPVTATMDQELLPAETPFDEPRPAEPKAKPSRWKRVKVRLWRGRVLSFVQPCLP